MRRFFAAPGVRIFLGCWLVLLLVPIWRTRLASQFPQIPLRPTYAENVEEVWRENARREAERLRVQFPEEPVALALALENARLVAVNRARPNLKQEGRGDEVFRDYLELVRRFPREKWLRVGALRFAMWGWVPIRWPERQGQTAYPDIPAWLSETQREKAAGLARQWAVLEPKNTFWPWMEAIFEFSLQHDAKALGALQRAAQGTFFDDGSWEWTRQKIDFETWHRRVLWEEKMEILSAYQHVSPLFSVGRRATFLGIQAEKTGNGAKGRAIYRDLMNAERVVRETSPQLWMRVGSARRQKILWEQVAKDAGAKVGTASDFRNMLRQAGEFDRVMRARGDAALGALASREARANELYSSLILNVFPLLPSDQDRLFLPLAQFFAVALAMLSLLSAFCWGLLVLVSRSQPVRGLMGAAFSCGAAWVVASSFAAAALDPMGQNWVPFLSAWPYVLLGVTVIPALGGTLRPYFRRSKLEFEHRPLDWGTIGRIVALCGIVAGVWTALWAFNTVWTNWWPAPFLFALSGALWSAFAIRDTRGLRRAAVCSFASAFGCLCLVLATLPPLELAPIAQPIFWGGIWVFLAVGLILRALDCQKNGGEFGAAWLDFMARLRVTMAALAVSSVALSMVVLLVIWPRQKQAERNIDRQIEVGQMAWFKEQQAQK